MMRQETNVPRGVGEYERAKLNGLLWTPHGYKRTGRFKQWVDASAPGSITLATGVSAWADQSEAGLNYTQATGGSQPGYTPRKSVNFTGSAVMGLSATGPVPTYDAYIVAT